MKRLLELGLSHVAILSMVGASFLPVCDLAAYSQNCCEEECFLPYNSNIWCWLGGALLGAAAGAGTGYAASRDGKRGHAGATGATGATGGTGATGVGATGATGPTGGSFTRDVGQTLTFNTTLRNISLSSAGATATVFVASPDGVVLEGSPVILSGTLVNFPSLTFTNPVFGEYNAGLQIIPPAGVVSALLDQTTLSSRDGLTFFADGVPISVTPTFAAQVSNDFTYGAPPVP